MIFKHGANSTQDVRFDKTRIQENQDNIIAFLGFKPKNYELYIFTDKMFTDENLNETKPVKFKVKIIREAGHVERIMPNFFVKKCIS